MQWKKIAITGFCAVMFRVCAIHAANDIANQSVGTGIKNDTVGLVSSKVNQTITFPAIGDKLTTDKVGLKATASSGLTVSFSVASGPAAISGGTNLTFSGAGSVSIAASQPGNSSYYPASDVSTPSM